MSNLNQFSIRILALDSALRNAEFDSEEAKIGFNEFYSGNFENGKKITILIY